MIVTIQNKVALFMAHCAVCMYTVRHNYGTPCYFFPVNVVIIVWTEWFFQRCGQNNLSASQHRL